VSLFRSLRRQFFNLIPRGRARARDLHAITSNWQESDRICTWWPPKIDR
jgi:hypothetical protein